MKNVRMSLQIITARQLLRYNTVHQLEIKACICTTPTLQQPEGKITARSSRGKPGRPVKLVGTPDVPKYIEKEKMVTRAMQLFLEKKRKEAVIREQNRNEMNLGERHLANIMGVDVNDLGPGDVKRALNYILPSGLHSKKARPTMEMPIDKMVERQSVSFTAAGKPKHFLYYTLKPTYFDMMHQMALLFEDLRKTQALLQQEGKSLEPDTEEEKLQKEKFDKMVRIGIVSFQKLKKQFGSEKVSSADAAKFNHLLNRIVSLPLAYKKMKFFEQFPRPDEAMERPPAVRQEDLPTDKYGNVIYNAAGSRKSIKAEVQLICNGTGEVTINNEDILFFDDVMQRQAILFPLKFVGKLGEYDIKATVTTSSVPGQSSASSQAGAIRLGVAKAIELFATEEEIFRMQRAGLLTRDPRRKERKKPGQEGARRKFTWKAR